MDRDWSRLPLGSVGQVKLTLEVDETGKLQELELESVALAPVIERMLRRAALLLRAGRFSLDPRKSSAGAEHLELEVTITQRSVSPDELASPTDLFAQSSEPPTRERPGYAQFTLNSGRHVRVLVRHADAIR